MKKPKVTKVKQKFIKSAPFRKGRVALNQVPRAIARQRSGPGGMAPVLVNSLPKSGTHLLMQVANALSGTVNYGTFIAQAPSFSFRERTQDNINSKIFGLVPGEVAGAHLHCRNETSAAIQERGALHLFIWRDPRDVILSLVHYLGEMNKWHALHKKFAKIPDLDGRISLAIQGDDTYPPAGQRMATYFDWLQDPNALAVRYEDISNPDARIPVLRSISERWAIMNGIDEPLNVTVERLEKAIDPRSSHTFNVGGISRWKREMSSHHLEMCREQFGDILDDVK